MPRKQVHVRLLLCSAHMYAAFGNTCLYLAKLGDRRRRTLSNPKEFTSLFQSSKYRQKSGRRSASLLPACLPLKRKKEGGARLQEGRNKEHDPKGVAEPQTLHALLGGKAKARE